MKAAVKLPRASSRVAIGPALEVSPICVGLVSRPEVIGAAFDAGINFFFLSADMHWPLYEATRRGLEQLFARGPKVRDQVVVAAAAYVTQPHFCHAPFTEVVESVRGLERLEVLVAGGVYWANFGPRMSVFSEHRASKFCGAQAIGASFHERAAARWAADHQVVDLAFIRFNAHHPGAAVDLLPRLPKERPAIFNFTSTYGHVPGGGFEVADHYRFALSQPGIDGVLCSLADEGELSELLAALDRGALSRDECAALVALAQQS